MIKHRNHQGSNTTMYKSYDGFTLIELMFVVSIIGILAAMAIPNYTVYRTQADIVESMVLSAPLTTAVTDYYSFHGTFPATNSSLELPGPRAFGGKNVEGIEVVDGAIHIHFRNSYGGGTQLSLRPVVVAAYPPSGTMSWLCGHVNPANGMVAYGEDRTDIPDHLLPPNCYQ